MTSNDFKTKIKDLIPELTEDAISIIDSIGSELDSMNTEIENSKNDYDNLNKKFKERFFSSPDTEAKKQNTLEKRAEDIQIKDLF